MMRVAVTLAALASASAFAPISAPMGLKLRAQNVARAPRSAGERQTSGSAPAERNGGAGRSGAAEEGSLQSRARRRDRRRGRTHWNSSVAAIGRGGL